jgi:hypothetical protein
MEPRGCNRWQPVAIGSAEQRLKQAKTFAVGCDRLRPGPHGKGRVDATSLLLKRGSPSSLRKEIESREPEGPQDSRATVTRQPLYWITFQ